MLQGYDLVFLVYKKFKTVEVLAENLLVNRSALGIVKSIKLVEKSLYICLALLIDFLIVMIRYDLLLLYLILIAD